MINQTTLVEDEDDDEEYGEHVDEHGVRYVHDEFLGDDEWEDNEAVALKKAKLPAGWYLIKIVDYRTRTLKEIDEWLQLNCGGAYERVGFSSSCSYTVGVGFEDLTDATFFKLRWR